MLKLRHAVAHHHILPAELRNDHEPGFPTFAGRIRPVESGDRNEGNFRQAESRKKGMDEREHGERDGVRGRLQQTRSPRRQARPDGGFERSGDAGRPNRSRQIPGAALPLHQADVDIGDAGLRIRMEDGGVVR